MRQTLTMNLRADETFVQDEGWYRAAERYEEFLRRHENLHILFLELGVGYNTPAIIKYPFWQMTAKNPKAVYACLNFGEAFVRSRSDRRQFVWMQILEQFLRDNRKKPLRFRKWFFPSLNLDNFNKM